jgi:hypothetical protein
MVPAPVLQTNVLTFVVSQVERRNKKMANIVNNFTLVKIVIYFTTVIFQHL